MPKLRYMTEQFVCLNGEKFQSIFMYYKMLKFQVNRLVNFLSYLIITHSRMCPHTHTRVRRTITIISIKIINIQVKYVSFHPIIKYNK